MPRDPHSRVAHGIGKNVRAIAEIERASLGRRSLGERVSDLVAACAGTTTFSLIHVVWFSLWVLINTNRLPGVPAFDPYPFNFLTLVVSLEAIFLSIFVLISQNRLTQEANMRAHIDLQVNLLAEQEATTSLRLLNRLCEHLGVDRDTVEDHALINKTDVKDIVSELQDTLPADSNGETDGQRSPSSERTV